MRIELGFRTKRLRRSHKVRSRSLLQAASLKCCCILACALSFQQRLRRDTRTDTVIQGLVDAALEPWLETGASISTTLVDAAFNVNDEQDAACFILQIIDGQIFTYGDQDRRADGQIWNPGRLFRTRRQNIILLVRAAQQRFGLPNLEAAFCLHDCVVSQLDNSSRNYFTPRYQKIPDPVPAFTVVSCIDSMNIPFPTWDYATGFFPSWKRKLKQLKLYASKKHWQKRQRKAVFRGGQRSCILYPNVGERTNGTAYYRVTESDAGNAKKCGRNALIYQALTSEHHDLFDVSLTDGIDPSVFNHGLLRAPNVPLMLSKEEQEDYRYQILAEGECQWANRLRDALISGSAIIMQDNECVEYYGLGLRPWEHYIPVDYWFTNLTDAVKWGEENEQLVQEMIDRKHEYASHVLHPENVIKYTYLLMKTYAGLLNFDVTLRAGAVKVPRHIELDPAP